jgi:F-type H+-transporting ATPase subunit delta
MADLRAASRYVKSLLGLAVEQGALEPVHADLQLFSQVCRDNKAFAVMIKSPLIRPEKKLEILKKIFTGKVNSLTLAIMTILTRKNREFLLPAIAMEFHNAYNVHKGIEKASIVTTTPMDARRRAEIEAIVKTLSHKKEVELLEKVDPDLIGGFILTVDDQQVDASIQSKLKMLKMKFSENPYIKEF